MTRPRQHHTAPTGWVNDPQLTWHDGRYHLFFQYLPDRTTWELGCHWGHATSTDLLTWEPAPVALAPGDGDDGCWSGSIAGGVVFYTSVSADRPEQGRIRRAVPADDSWTTWIKQDVVIEPPAEATHFRDPFVRYEGDGWRMVVGCATAAGPAVWSYRTRDLKSWHADGIVAARPGTEWTGKGWECPALVEVDGSTVLLVSVWEPDALHYLAYAVCSPDDTADPGLHPGTFRRLSYGPSPYAATAFADREGRPGIVAWLREVGDTAAGWAGATSIPALVSLRDGRLELAPVTATEAWSPAVGDSLERSGYTLLARTGSVLLTSGGHRVELPWSGETLRLVADGPVLEVYGEDGWAAVPLG
ncbi:MAG TPA: glycoside hydrolase family 32 protein [Nocardioides sp.]|uniref:glycoside hydrolase family 32 protein n=1 Tax=uncultured Nocardioides sp. TaxID=198441 RepID=UPI0026323A2C|nr:glycoside hydrolase family 32 protein [uncultured Nocardioides sp.]HRI98984.1 glycoside hydrolase family 32 protein [Nocardioides sp.]HRK48685.1 glycoside hydrolase family 32 protein [Nocardioides sp.]